MIDVLPWDGTVHPAEIDAKRTFCILLQDKEIHPMGVAEQVGQRIRELRLAWSNGQGLSQQELADQIGTTANTISRWESAVYKPGLEDLEQIARFFRVPLSSFFPPEIAAVPTEPMQALLRAAEGLDSRDLDELRRYAEFRRLSSIQHDIPRRSTKRRKVIDD